MLCGIEPRKSDIAGRSALSFYTSHRSRSIFFVGFGSIGYAFPSKGAQQMAVTNLRANVAGFSGIHNDSYRCSEGFLPNRIASEKFTPARSARRS
jgi:hypothetical protein